MGSIDVLVGTWVGRNSLWLQPGAAELGSATSATVYSVAAGRVLSMDYAWVYEGEPQDGRLMVALEEGGRVHMAWCDSFHLDAAIMDLEGDEGGEVFTATGSYRVADSEPWGWRIELEQQGDGAFQMRMFNILPSSLGGVEALAVRADYSRV